MFLNNTFPFNRSYKVHAFIGVLLSVLLTYILIALKPYNINNFNHEYGEVLLMGFGLSNLIGYLLAHFVENQFHNKKGCWTWTNEITFLLLSTILETILGYIYLDAVFEKQPLSLLRLVLFFFYIVAPILPLIALPKIILRYLFAQKSHVVNLPKIDNGSSATITLTGQNAKDKLSVLKEHLLCVKSIDNYVMVFYEDGSTKNKILRATLSEILIQAPFLIQAHRSYLINPKQEFTIKGNSQKSVLISKKLEEVIPIARASYKMVKNRLNYTN